MRCEAVRLGANVLVEAMKSGVCEYKRQVMS